MAKSSRSQFKRGFLANPEAQDLAMTMWAELIWKRYIAGVTMGTPGNTRDLDKYEGQMLNGVEITVSGMIAGVHLVGQGDFRTHINSGGDIPAYDGSSPPVSVTRYLQSQANDSKGVGGISLPSDKFKVDHS
jgi:hypothetical protein